MLIIRTPVAVSLRLNKKFGSELGSLLFETGIGKSFVPVKSQRLERKKQTRTNKENISFGARVGWQFWRFLKLLNPSYITQKTSQHT